MWHHICLLFLNPKPQTPKLQKNVPRPERAHPLSHPLASNPRMRAAIHTTTFAATNVFLDPLSSPLCAQHLRRSPRHRPAYPDPATYNPSLPSHPSIPSHPSLPSPSLPSHPFHPLGGLPNPTHEPQSRPASSRATPKPCCWPASRCTTISSSSREPKAAAAGWEGGEVGEAEAEAEAVGVEEVGEVGRESAGPRGRRRPYLAISSCRSLGLGLGTVVMARSRRRRSRSWGSGSEERGKESARGNDERLNAKKTSLVPF